MVGTGLVSPVDIFSKIFPITSEIIEKNNNIHEFIFCISLFKFSGVRYSFK